MRNPFAVCQYVLVALLVTLTQLNAADPGAIALTCERAAGWDYKIQGEYKNDEFGGQVIALGYGKFKAVGFAHGLPGDGWERGDESYPEAKGGFDDGKVVLKGELPGHVEVDGEKLVVFEEDGSEMITLNKVHRKSPTLGAKPPEGAVVLFDGTNLDEWENGKLIDGKYLGATNVSTKRKFNDHVLHLEFRLPYMPTSSGQGRGNSGVYVQGRYEVQVLDSFGLDGKDNECGGIYSINKPKVNACLPPLVWQTYDIEFTSAKYDGDKKIKNGRITVKHNGITIHDDQELSHDTPGRHKEGPGPDALFLQDHGNPVVYRNVWVVEK